MHTLPLLSNNLTAMQSKIQTLLNQPDIDGFCKGSAEQFVKYTMDNIADIINTIQREANTCWADYDSIKKGFMCGYCNYDIQSIYSYDGESKIEGVTF